jgi:predicted RNase H-like nuclease (RuvC/YqgF family)
MRRRQSMQVLELESRVDQLMAENRMLTEARTHAEQTLNQKAAGVLSDRDSEIEALNQSLQFLQNEVTRLAEVNEGLTSANAELASKDTGRFADMTRELDEARGVHTTFTQSLQDKDAEIADLRAQLDEAKEQIRQMQRKILESKAGDSARMSSSGCCASPSFPTCAPAASPTRLMMRRPLTAWTMPSWMEPTSTSISGTE